MPKAPPGYHKCADGKTIRPLIPPKGPINPRAKRVGSQRLRYENRVIRAARARARRIRKSDWEGTGSRKYAAMGWWSRVIYRLKIFLSDRAKILKKHKALYKKRGRVKLEQQFTVKPLPRREQHK